MKIAVGADHRGFKLKEKIRCYLTDNGIETKDYGCFDESTVDYPDVAINVAKSVSCKDYDKGILVCGTGIGMSIAANRVKGVRAALCYDKNTAKMSRRHNDSNVLALGGLYIEWQAAKDILSIWLNTQFDSGRHLERIQKIDDLI